eukprot:TRINITY_DN12975_c0_g1_i1.p1 TRINITY_DN12975_c0_g1~~TRINITY_DN12975_c0_g1_i1.p1  ORF type:complete len:1116 (-),score=130.14 TRINITY_DN12975_c0_g1_i1:153-3500(-)
MGERTPKPATFAASEEEEASSSVGEASPTRTSDAVETPKADESSTSAARKDERKPSGRDARGPCRGKAAVYLTKSCNDIGEVDAEPQSPLSPSPGTTPKWPSTPNVAPSDSRKSTKRTPSHPGRRHSFSGTLASQGSLGDGMRDSGSKKPTFFPPSFYSSGGGESHAQPSASSSGGGQSATRAARIGEFVDVLGDRVIQELGMRIDKTMNDGIARILAASERVAKKLIKSMKEQEDALSTKITTDLVQGLLQQLTQRLIACEATGDSQSGRQSSQGLQALGRAISGQTDQSDQRDGNQGKLPAIPPHPGVHQGLPASHLFPTVAQLGASSSAGFNLGPRQQVGPQQRFKEPNSPKLRGKRGSFRNKAPSEASEFDIFDPERMTYGSSIGGDELAVYRANTGDGRDTTNTINSIAIMPTQDVAPAPRFEPPPAPRLEPSNFMANRGGVRPLAFPKQMKRKPGQKPARTQEEIMSRVHEQQVRQFTIERIDSIGALSALRLQQLQQERQERQSERAAERQSFQAAERQSLQAEWQSPEEGGLFRIPTIDSIRSFISPVATSSAAAYARGSPNTVKTSLPGTPSPFSVAAPNVFTGVPVGGLSSTDDVDDWTESPDNVMNKVASRPSRQNTSDCESCLPGDRASTANSLAAALGDFAEGPERGVTVERHRIATPTATLTTNSSDKRPYDSDGPNLRSCERLQTSSELLHRRVGELTGSVRASLVVPEVSTNEVGSDDSEMVRRRSHCSMTVRDGAEITRCTSAFYEGPPWILGLAGLVPFSAESTLCLWYQRIIFLLVVLSSILLMEGALIWDDVECVHAECDGGATPQIRGYFSDVPICAGAVIGLILLGSPRGSHCLLDAYDLLLSFMRCQGLLDTWLHSTRYDVPLVFTLWLSGLVLRAAPCFTETEYFQADGSAGQALRLVAYGFISLVFLSLIYCVSHICRALATTVDLFSCGVVDHPIVQEIANEWNILQAVLRKTSATLEYSFFVLQFSGSASVLLCAVDIAMSDRRMAVAVSVAATVLLNLSMVRMVFSAAAISDKCGRVPPLINSLCFGEGTEEARQYVIQYILHSAAGFYVFDVRLCTGMALKLIYFWCVVTAGLSAQILPHLRTGRT